jgi:hypothetical protein
MIRDGETGAGGSRRLWAMLAALVAIVLVLAFGPGRAAAPMVPDRAHYTFLTAQDAALAAPERASWKRPQGESRDGDAAGPAETLPRAAPTVARRPGWPVPPAAPAGHAALRLPPARGPPGAVA